MNYIRNFFPRLLVFAVSFLVFSCIKKEKYDKMEMEAWEPSLAVPLINSTLTLKDVAEKIDESEINVIEKSNGLYVFVYKDTLYSDYAENLIKIPDQSFQNDHSVTTNEAIQLSSGISVEKEYSDTYLFNTENDQNIHYADLKSGLLNFSFTSTFKHDILLTLTIPALSKNGETYSETFQIDYSGSTPVSITQNINLEGYKIDLSGNGGQTNTFNYVLNAKITSSGAATNTTESVQFKVDISDLQYHLLYGTIGNYVFPPYKGSVNIEVFDNAEQGEVIFNDPLLKLTLENTFGVESSFIINKLETETNYGVITPVTSNGTLQIPGPNVINASQTPGVPAVTNFSLDKSNSNIVDAFKTAPSNVNYEITPSIGSNSGDPSFILDTSRVKAFMEAEIPMDGSIKVFAITDTILDIELPDREYIESALVKIKTTNSLPVDVTFQGFWLDANGNKLDTLIIPQEDILVSGEVNSNGEVVSPAEKYIEVLYDANRYNRIKEATQLLLIGDLTSSNNGQTMVKFFSHNKLQIQISVLVKAKVEF